MHLGHQHFFHEPILHRSRNRCHWAHEDVHGLCHLPASHRPEQRHADAVLVGLRKGVLLFSGNLLLEGSCHYANIAHHRVDYLLVVWCNSLRDRDLKRHCVSDRAFCEAHATILLALAAF